MELTQTWIRSMDFSKPKRAVHSVFIHCSASDNPDHDSVQVMRRWHVEGRGWSDVGYHYFIRKNGEVEAGRNLERTPAAQRGHNRGSIAICLHGLDEGGFTPAQFSSLRALCWMIDEAYKTRLRFRGHREVAAKACPAFDYKAILKLTPEGFLPAMVSPEAINPVVSVNVGLTIVAVSGYKGAGKGSLCEEIEIRLKDLGLDCSIESFADPIRSGVNGMFDRIPYLQEAWRDAQAGPDEKEAGIGFLEGNQSYRELCVAFGEAGRAVLGDRFWASLLAMRVTDAKQVDVLLVDDWRRNSELAVLQELTDSPVLTVRVKSPGVESDGTAPESEAIAATYSIYNDHGISFQRAARELTDDVILPAVGARAAERSAR